MPIWQHYYTSCTHELTGRSGWQTKASSREITPQLDATIQGLVGYKPPRALPSTQIASHPVALRYLYDASSSSSFLLCSQSTGLDNQQRPGNFFAHTLLIPSDELPSLASFPPILAWHSPIWRREDPDQRHELPALELHDVQEGLDIQQVWGFLARGRRRQELFQLLCALVHWKRPSRRILLLDSNEHIAWWIAAVSIHLPPAYYPFLSFATYHHAPLEQRYLLTGTTRDWWERIAGRAQILFVLDAERGTQSHPVMDSHYARLVTSVSSPEEFWQYLAPLFERYARRFPPQEGIDERLELFARYVQLLSGRHKASLADEEFLALHSALDTFQPGEQDDEELERIQEILLGVPQQHDVRVSEALARVGHLRGKTM